MSTGVDAPDLLGLLALMEAPTRDCGHKVPMDNIEHAETCLNQTCPHCGIRERNGYAIVMEHDAFDESFIARWGTCSVQRWWFERVASCLRCHWPTFGVWPCRNEHCADGCDASHPYTPCPAETARWDAQSANRSR